MGLGETVKGVRPRAYVEPTSVPDGVTAYSRVRLAPKDPASSCCTQRPWLFLRMRSSATIEAHILKYHDAAHEVDRCFGPQASLTLFTTDILPDSCIHRSSLR